MIERIPVEVFEEDYRCDECAIGYMRPSGMVLNVNPPVYPHVCNNQLCGKTQNFGVTYPQITYEMKRDDVR